MFMKDVKKIVTTFMCRKPLTRDFKVDDRFENVQLRCPGGLWRIDEKDGTHHDYTVDG